VLLVAVTLKADVSEAPSVVSVTVTVFVLEVALIPAEAGQRAIAADTSPAKVVVLLLVTKVPVVPAQPADPLVPAVTPPQVK